ncbi:MAG: lamin tail domain-containing protein [Sandaracinaceae bacterium]|nr:lamin tail domain-containing protein [Sandaracinaceae bacterium]
MPSSAALLLGACLDVGIPSREPPAADAGVLPSPLLVATWPAHGSAGVPDELPRAWIALGPEGPSMRIQTGWRGPLGAIAHRAEQRPCTEMGVEAAVCLRLDPLTRLPSGEHELGVDEGSLDAQGAPVMPTFVRFEVTGAEVDPALPSATDCERDEESISGFCLLRSDDALRVRAFLTASAIVELGAGGVVARSLAERAETTLWLRGLDADTFYTVRMEALSLSGATTTVDTLVRTHPPLAQLSITEVLADPLGPDPDQEYVELLNHGPVPLPLAGLTLADAPEREGDEVTSGVVLAPGARVLLVAARFDAGAMHGDAPIPPGVPIVRLEGPIATGGLTNSGEPLYLRDAQGRRLSAVPAVAGGVEGRCAQRVGDDPRSGEPGAFITRASCTPGGAADGETW